VVGVSVLSSTLVWKWPIVSVSFRTDDGDDVDDVVLMKMREHDVFEFVYVYP
jgi:hypothetical protein